METINKREAWNKGKLALPPWHKNLSMKSPKQIQCDYDIAPTYDAAYQPHLGDHDPFVELP